MQDLGGVAVTSAALCATQCDATANCNGASYYDDPAAFFGSAAQKNCWMKTFTDICEPPETAADELLAELILKSGDQCAWSAGLVVMCLLSLEPSNKCKCSDP